ncbi:hypothetical protein EC973_006169 [Apophysomyces ossiformis]|uniref:Cas12f1-like TNB domain-containing protein n=1 Tax=Apophysomyces ossiformis TaxID=679940 RepID=A0A8H7EKS5_9FUNG|nr:hypothetical protein EC973_006169 [Apophysomyces ossiformis]
MPTLTRMKSPDDDIEDQGQEEHRESIYRYYDQRFASLRYIGRQEATEEFVSRLINGGDKYWQKNSLNRRRHRLQRRRRKSKRKEKANGQKGLSVDLLLAINLRSKAKWKKATPTRSQKKPLIAFRNAKLFNTIRGKRTGVVSTIYRKLKEKEKRDLCAIIEIDEYKTSKICSNCDRESLTNVKGSLSQSLHAVLKCKTCSTVWNHDLNSCRNIRRLAIYQAHHEDTRPPEFTREKHTSYGDKPHATHAGRSRNSLREDEVRLRYSTREIQHRLAENRGRTNTFIEQPHIRELNTFLLQQQVFANEDSDSDEAPEDGSVAHFEHVNSRPSFFHRQRRLVSQPNLLFFEDEASNDSYDDDTASLDSSDNCSEESSCTDDERAPYLSDSSRSYSERRTTSATVEDSEAALHITTQFDLLQGILLGERQRNTLREPFNPSVTASGSHARGLDSLADENFTIRNDGAFLHKYLTPDGEYDQMLAALAVTIYGSMDPENQPEEEVCCRDIILAGEELYGDDWLSELKCQHLQKAQSNGFSMLDLLTTVTRIRNRM